jgi:hypothetical protein
MIRNKKWLWLIVIFPLLMFTGFVIWAYTPLGPMPKALSALQSTATVQVIDDRWLVFEPTTNLMKTGLIIYPGGRVDPRSYSPTAKQLSSSGYLVVIVPMPLNLAVFGTERASDVMEVYPEIENWVIAGHSLGGSMAARYAYLHQDDVQALILWAAYPAENDDLSNAEFFSTSVFGTLDGLTTAQDIDRSRHLLPENVIWVPIEGGNHAQFGWYGDQPGDNPALISREQQQQIIIESTKNILDIFED